MSDKTRPPIFNKVPFKKIKLPELLYSKIQDEYRRMRFDNVITSDLSYESYYNTVTSGGISIKGSETPYYHKSDVSEQLKNECYKVLTPILEEWCGKSLDVTWAYGIRSYIRNSILHLHRDRIKTHVISCIIFVDQKSEKNWPLDFYDHDHNHHQVFFEDGDLLMYESLCVHGRETPFQGKYYRNMYFHWKPSDWDFTPYRNMRTAFVNKYDIINYYK